MQNKNKIVFAMVDFKGHVEMSIDGCEEIRIGYSIREIETRRERRHKNSVIQRTCALKMYGLEKVIRKK